MKVTKKDEGEGGCIMNAWPFPNQFEGSQAVRVTRAAREKQHIERLLPEINAQVLNAFDQIACAAARGEGQIDCLFPNCSMEIQLLAMKYLAGCGYKTHPDALGGVVRWYDN